MDATKTRLPKLSKLHPAVVTKAPELKEVMAMVEKTQKLMDACALFFSWALKSEIAMVVAPVNKKFHPIPKTNKADTN